MFTTIAWAQDSASANRPIESHRISERTARALAEAWFTYEVPLAPPVVRGPANLTQSDSYVVLLPKVFVRGDHLPRASQVLTAKGLAEKVMNQYLGPIDGIDRGLLNAYNVGELWHMLPILGKLPVPIPFMTNSQRTLLYYRQDERIRQMRDLEELSDLTSMSGDTATAARIRAATSDAFRRPLRGR